MPETTTATLHFASTLGTGFETSTRGAPMSLQVFALLGNARSAQEMNSRAHTGICHFEVFDKRIAQRNDPHACKVLESHPKPTRSDT